MTARMTSAEFRARRIIEGGKVTLGPARVEVEAPRAEKPKGRSHFNASPTTCERGHRHPSKVEARVCASVYAEYGSMPSVFVYWNPRLPLWSLPPDEKGHPYYASIDFAVTGPLSRSGFIALIDAKSPKGHGRHRSRDWKRGAAAVEATYGVRVEERS